MKTGTFESQAARQAGVRQRGHLLVATPPVLSHKYIEVLLTLVRKPLFGHLLSCSVFARVVYAQSICFSELVKASLLADRLALFVKALEHVGEFAAIARWGEQEVRRKTLASSKCRLFYE